MGADQFQSVLMCKWLCKYRPWFVSVAGVGPALHKCRQLSTEPGSPLRIKIAHAFTNGDWACDKLELVQCVVPFELRIITKQDCGFGT